MAAPRLRRRTNLALGLIGALVGGLMVRMFGLFPRLDAIAISLRDVVAACVGSLVVLAALWAWDWRKTRAARGGEQIRSAQDPRRHQTHKMAP